MKWPWVNYPLMQKIRSEQVFIYRFSPTKKKKQSNDAKGQRGSENQPTDGNSPITQEKIIVETIPMVPVHKERKEESGIVHLLKKEIPFAIHVEVDDFLHVPILSLPVENSFAFLSLDNGQKPDLNTKVLQSVKKYPEKVDCRLVSSFIHELLFLTKLRPPIQSNEEELKVSFQSVAVPMHKKLKSNTKRGPHPEALHNGMHFTAPVVLGEYKLETCIESDLVFEQDILQIKEISQEVVLKRHQFIPLQFSDLEHDGAGKVTKGSLLVEGIIQQHIVYTDSPGHEKAIAKSNHLVQKMALELVVFLRQVQQIQIG